MAHSKPTDLATFVEELLLQPHDDLVQILATCPPFIKVAYDAAAAARMAADDADAAEAAAAEDAAESPCVGVDGELPSDIEDEDDGDVHMPPEQPEPPVRACRYGAGCRKRNSGCGFKHPVASPHASNACGVSCGVPVGSMTPCRYGAGCNKRDSGCTFEHPVPPAVEPPAVEPPAVEPPAVEPPAASNACGGGALCASSKVPCRFGVRCNKRDSGCTFGHPALVPCRFGVRCNKRDSGCTFGHPAAAPPPVAVLPVAPPAGVCRKGCNGGAACHGSPTCPAWRR